MADFIIINKKFHIHTHTCLLLLHKYPYVFGNKSHIFKPLTMCFSFHILYAILFYLRTTKYLYENNIIITLVRGNTCFFFILM